MSNALSSDEWTRKANKNMPAIDFRRGPEANPCFEVIKQSICEKPFYHS